MTDPIACLTIGSSDSSGGAGIQGDIKAFASIGCYAATVVVGVTAQNTEGVLARHGVPIGLVRQQLRCVLTDLPIRAVKIGTTWSAELIDLLAAELADLPVPIVVDPVLVTAAGSVLSDVDEIRASLGRGLFPMATVITPNRTEAELLVGARPGALARDLLAEALVELGAPAVVVTGDANNHGDWFFDGTRHQHITGPWHDNGAEHGAGCAHSSLVAGLLAHGVPLPAAARLAHQRAADGVQHGLRGLGGGVHPVDVLGIAAHRPSSLLDEALATSSRRR